MIRAYIALGSNLDRPIEQVRAAVTEIDRLPETQVSQCSSLYRTAPVGSVADQPEFINAVCEVRTQLSAETLMQSLLDIELAHGRVRAMPGGARTLDLDLLIYGALAQETAALSLPHPRLHERAFVLYPLSEIAPALVVPGRGSVTQLLAQCANQRVERIGDEWNGRP